MPKKKFIDKKNSVTFHLVHRSQQDPLVADEKAPQRVLLPVNKKEKEKRIEEQHKFGVFFDDEYNYLQHLREPGNRLEWVQAEKLDTQPAPRETKNANINLPSSVFASQVEEKVGLLNKAAPTGLRLDLDPDVVAAMDDDYNFDDPENELEDNFIELANAACSDEEEMEEDFSSNYSGEEDDELGSLNGGEYGFDEEETKSRFTEYSMTSSVIRRNEQLTLLDDRFENMFKAYDDNEIGALDCDEIEGHVPESSELLLKYAEEFENSKQGKPLDKNVDKYHLADYSSDSDDSTEFINMEVKPKEKWDCESILSTYSNIYNHPKLITEPRKIKINSRTGIPVGVIDSNKLTAKALSKLDAQNSEGRKGMGSVGAHSIISTLSMLSVRNKDETPEEKKERKRLLKEYRHERRVERKANTEAFKLEAKRQNKININNRNNVQGNRIL